MFGYLNMKVDLNDVITDEVVKVAWMNREQIKESFDANMFMYILEYFFMKVDKKQVVDKPLFEREACDDKQK